MHSRMQSEAFISPSEQLGLVYPVRGGGSRRILTQLGKQVNALRKRRM